MYTVKIQAKILGSQGKRKNAVIEANKKIVLNMSTLLSKAK